MSTSPAEAPPLRTAGHAAWWGRWRRPAEDGVSICIPAWQSQAFIGRTLDFALGQTHPGIRVLVSIDHCEDETVAICLERARHDRRLVVFAQAERLGWAGNVNFLLGQVATPYFLLYFHDDVIAPQYTARLLSALRARPDAASAYCPMDHFGAARPVSVGLAYEGTAAHRLATFLLAPDRGSPLRALTRSELLGRGLRMPTGAVDGLWANEPYLMRLVAAGPALHVPETLYFRWNQREGGLTDGWRRLSPAQVRAGYATNIGIALEIIDQATSDPAERLALAHCLYLYLLPRLRGIERESGGTVAADPAAMGSRFAAAAEPRDLARLGGDIAEWGAQRLAWLRAQQRAQPAPA